MAVLSNFCRCFACALFACVLFVFGGTGVAWATSDVCTITLNPNNGTGGKQGGDSSSSTNDTKTIYSQYGDGAYKTNTNDVLSNQMTSQSGLGDTPPSPALGIPVGRNVTWTFDAQTSAPIDPITGNQYSVTNPSDLVKQRSFVGYYSTTNGTTSAPMVWLSQNADKQCIDADGYITSYGQGLAESIAQNNGSCPATAWYAQYDCKNSGNLPSVTVLGHTVIRWKDGGTNLPTVGGTSMCTDHNFVAIWEANTYTITYAPGVIGGNSVSKSVNFDANVYTDNTALAVITNPFTVPTGYVFTGWASNYDVGTGTPTTNPMTSYDEGDSLGYYKVVGSTTMTAQWDCDTANGYFWSDVTNQCEPGYEITINNGNCFEWDMQPVPAVLYTIHGTGVYLDAARTQKMEPRVNGEGGQNPLQQVAQANYSVYYDTQTNIPTNPAGAAYVVPSLDPVGLTMVCNGGINSQALYIVQGYITQAGVDRAKIVTSNQTWGLSGCQCGGKNLASLSQIAIEGYTAGWYDNVEGNGNSMSYISCSGLGNSFYCSKEATVYAHWTPKNYTVTYDCDDGHIVGDTESTTTSNTATFDTPYTFLTGADTCEKAGFVFNQWECKKGNTTIDQTTNAQYWKVNGAVTCTASYSSNTVNLQWRPNGGTLGTTMPNSCVYYTSGGISGISPNPTKTGYTFNGWRISNWDECGATSIDWEHDETHFSAITRGSLGQYDTDSNFCWYDNSGAPGYCSSPIFSDLELYGWKVESASGTVYGESKCNNSYDDYDDVSEGSICWCKLVDYTPSGQPKCHLYTFAGHMHRAYDNRNYCISDCARSCGSGVKQHYIRVFE